MPKRYPLPWPSVTEVLNTVFRPYSGIPKAVLEQAAKDGRRLHKHIAFILQGIEVPFPMDLSPALSGFKDYAAHCIERVVWVERHVKIPSIKVQGRPDALVVLKNEKVSTLIDWKYYTSFSALSKLLVDLQTAAYAKGILATYRQPVAKRMAMHIQKANPGSWPKCIELKNQKEAYDEFLWSLRMFHRLI
jgi:hypothetical protein